MEKEIKAKSYTLWGDNGEWLGQIVLTSDGTSSASKGFNKRIRK